MIHIQLIYVSIGCKIRYKSIDDRNKKIELEYVLTKNFVNFIKYRRTVDARLTHG